MAPLDYADEGWGYRALNFVMRLPMEENQEAENAKWKVQGIRAVAILDEWHGSLGHDVFSAIQKWYNLNLIRESSENP